MIASSQRRITGQRRTRFLAGLMFAVVALVATGCSVSWEFGDGVYSTLDGEGSVENESFVPGSSFDSVRITDTFDATIEVGPDASVVVTAHENFFPHIDVSIDGDELTIETVEGIRLEGVADVVVTLPSLENLEVSGTSSATIAGSVNAEEFRVEVHGASEVTIDKVNAVELIGDVTGASDLKFKDINAVKLVLDVVGTSEATVSGQARSVSLDVAGASGADLGGLDIDDISLSIHGSSDADVRRAAKVQGDVSGTSGVDVDGEAIVNVDLSGLSEIRQN